jgi:Dolichyl-phosphate-mannose-protein mannosyltransferase
MTRNKKHAASPAKQSITLSMLVWGAVLAVSFLRLSVAAGGAPTEQEAFLLACAGHPAGGYVEGAPGAPLLLALTHAGFPALRWIPVLATLLLSWCVWWLGRRVAPHRPAVALWSLLAVNALPTVTAASLVMNGASVGATLVLLAVVAGWHATTARVPALGSWTLLGVALGVATLFWLPSGLILIPVLCFTFVRRGFREFPWRGSLLALGFLILGWIAPLTWNASNRWIGWYGVASGWDSLALGSRHLSLGLVVAGSALLVPWLVLLGFRSRIWSTFMLLLAVASASVSGIWLMIPNTIPPVLPSPIGVRGVGEIAEAVLTLRKERPDAKGQPAFLIASTPGLAALLGSRISQDYPERPGAPSVFVAESPSMESSFAFWPSYPDAVAGGKPDNLYTEEKSASPFLGRNALYITTETREELPQTLTGSFGAIGLLRELPIDRNGKSVTIRIYQCEEYRTVSL